MKILLHRAWMFLVVVFLTAACTDRATEKSNLPAIDPITIKDAYGLTAEEITEHWKTSVNQMDRSFDLLVSKNLHPYQPPPNHELLRFGKSYLILEFTGGRLIAIHHVSG